MARTVFCPLTWVSARLGNSEISHCYSLLNEQSCLSQSCKTRSPWLSCHFILFHFGNRRVWFAKAHSSPTFGPSGASARVVQLCLQSETRPILIVWKEGCLRMRWRRQRTGSFCGSRSAFIPNNRHGAPL